MNQLPRVLQYLICFHSNFKEPKRWLILHFHGALSGLCDFQGLLPGVVSILCGNHPNAPKELQGLTFRLCYQPENQHLMKSWDHSGWKRPPGSSSPTINLAPGCGGIPPKDLTFHAPLQQGLSLKLHPFTTTNFRLRTALVLFLLRIYFWELEEQWDQDYRPRLWS